MRKRWPIPLIVSIIIISIGVICFIFLNNHWTSEELSIDSQVISKINGNSQTLDLKTIIHQAEKNVIQIEGLNDNETITGSGFLYNEQGDIITNAHVIKNADSINVRTANAHIYPAAIVGIGEDLDIAVIRVPQLSGKSYLSVEEEEGKAEIGDEIIALGSPHGYQNTVTLGIISGSERNFSVDGFDYADVYQISAQITHGNSGGPLINRKTGNVIGINSVGTEDGTIGFSIPINEVIDQIKQWSNEAENEDLNFLSLPDVIKKLDPEQLKKDADYLIDYFFDAIQLRDYIDAYTLLGSEMQSRTSYVDFREKYSHITGFKYTEVSNNLTEENYYKIVVDTSIETEADAKEKDQNNNKYTFIIGLENDQLKILNITTS